MAADAAVRDLVGACVRLTEGGVPARTTVRVLDRNLIDQLAAVGLRVDGLLVPCSTAGGAETADGASAVGLSGDQSTASAVRPGAGLAFTGADLLRAAVAAACLLWLGSLLLRAGVRLAPATRLR